MSTSELKFYFGVHSADGVDSRSFEVVHIIERHSVEKRSGIESAASLSFSISTFGKDFDLDDLGHDSMHLKNHQKIPFKKIEYKKKSSISYKTPLQIGLL